ncbi:MAG: hypothetical protein ACI95X_001300 [Paraglaciecola sp.]|jgi:hypothetical protein
MRNLVLLFLLCCCQACMTITPVELSPDALHQRIATGEIIKPGDNIKIVTADGSHHEFRVTALTSTQVTGEEQTFEISDIIAVENRKVSWGKTALLVGGTYLITLTLVIISLGGVLAL